MSPPGDCTSPWPPDQPEYFPEMFGRGSPAPQPMVHNTFESLRIRRCNSGLGRDGEMTCLWFRSVRTMMLQQRNPYRISPGLNARRGSSSRSHFPTTPNML